MSFRSGFDLLSHSQKVLRLYKKAYRHTESWITDKASFRYEATLLRARFDEHKDEKNLLKAQELLNAGEAEFWEKQHPQPYIFIDSPGGTRYERNIPPPDWSLDLWHPTERAQYPSFFAKRNKRIADERARWKELEAEEKALLEGKTERS